MHRLLVLSMGLLLGASTDLGAQSPDHVFEMGDGQVEVEGTVFLTLEYTITGSDQSNALSFGITHDPLFATVVALQPGAALVAMNGGQGPDFFSEDYFSDGVILGVLFSFSGAASLLEGTHEVGVFTYRGGEEVGGTPLIFTDTLGSPPVETVTVVGGVGIAPTQIDGELLVGTSPDFLRGDANIDGAVDLSDAIQILLELFVPGSTPSTCPDATDVTGDATSDISDAVSLLAYLFTPGSPPPAAPFPDCGVDDALGCDEYTACP